MIKTRDGKEIQTHRIALSTTIPFFEILFKADFKDRKENIVNLHNVEFSILKDLINYCYTTIIQINTENVQDLLLAADFFQVIDISYQKTNKKFQ